MLILTENGNRMNFIQFKELFYPYQIVSVREILKTIPAFNTRRLVEWQQKGYLKKIRNNWYLFSDIKQDEHFQFLIANRIYSPSDISLESALSYYNIIPETTFSVFSVCSLKTQEFNIFSVRFKYHHVKPTLLFGYKLIGDLAQSTRIAYPEKAIIDYLYLHSEIKSIEDLEGMRFNYSLIKESIDPLRMKDYAGIFQSKALINRVNLLINALYD
jgi:predicted transcriptional regulator of viral defense system